MVSQLNDSRQTTHDCIFRHPAVQNLGWPDVRSMPEVRIEVAQEPNENLKITSVPPATKGANR